MQKNKNLTPFYAAVFSSFLIFVIVCILVFFHYNRMAIRENAKDTIMVSVDREQAHFNSIIELQYEYLEGLAAYIGESTDVVTEDSLQLIKDIANKSNLDLIALIDADGNAWYSNGSTKNLDDREYFQESLAGERALSTPVESKVDGTTRVILSVPIFNDGSVIGVIGGSYDIGDLGNMLFNEIYDGSGQFLIVTQDGSVISQNGESLFTLNTDDSIFSIYTDVRSVDISVTNWKNDFSEGASRLITLTDAPISYYCYYEELGLSNWMLCYIVPMQSAHASYSLFTTYETRLFQVLLVGLITALVIIFVVTFRRQKRLVHFAETDALTGISNKKTTEEAIKLWLTDEECYSTQAFLMLDIDFFKTINDAHGHAVGDIVLGKVGSGLKQIFRESDIIGRLGGDEFCVFMKNASPESAVDKASEICEMVRNIKADAVPDLSVTCSIGVALFPQHAKNFMDLYKKADKALYLSKNNGRNQYTLYDIRTMEK